MLTSSPSRAGRSEEAGAPAPARPRLSVVVPVYNEEGTVSELLRRVANGPYPFPDKEVIVVDDGSTDRTPDVVRGWADRPGFTVLCHPVNRGKGAAVRTGFAVAEGEVLLVQDADLEYDPADYPRLVEPIINGEAQVVGHPAQPEYRRGRAHGGWAPSLGDGGVRPVTCQPTPRPARRDGPARRERDRTPRRASGH